MSDSDDADLRVKLDGSGPATGGPGTARGRTRSRRWRTQRESRIAIRESKGCARCRRRLTRTAQRSDIQSSLRGTHCSAQRLVDHQKEKTHSASKFGAWILRRFGARTRRLGVICGIMSAIACAYQPASLTGRSSFLDSSLSPLSLFLSLFLSLSLSLFRSLSLPLSLA